MQPNYDLANLFALWGWLDCMSLLRPQGSLTFPLTNYLS
jgi:hypothetical protein